MGTGGRSRAEVEADAFFAQFIDASPDMVAAEAGGDAAAVVREDREFGYWARVTAARAQRRQARQRVNAAARAREVAAATRLAHPVEAARLAPLPASSVALLPPVRVARVTGEEQAESARWWAGLRTADRRTVLANRVRREVKRGWAVQAPKTMGVSERWRLEQRAFERAQWRAVLAVQAARRRKRVANRWAAISEQRALEIAIAALEAHPPQVGN